MYRNSKFIRMKTGGGTLASNWASKTGQSILSRKSLRSKNLFSSTRGGEGSQYTAVTQLASLYSFLILSLNSIIVHHAQLIRSLVIVLPFNVPMFVISSRKKERKQLTLIINIISFIVTRQSNSYMRNKN